jgi:hypothetical protein
MSPYCAAVAEEYLWIRIVTTGVLLLDSLDNPNSAIAPNRLEGGVNRVV